MRMLCALSVFAFSLFACASVALDDPEVVDSVDLKKYQGAWFEIAKIPNNFQDQCLANTVAEYSIKENGRVKVVNSCDVEGGEREAATGEAKSKNDGNSKLKVTFAKLFGKWVYLFGGKYWVLDLAEDYSYSIVGHPNRNYGWVLSRTPSLDLATLRHAAEVFEKNGYDVCEFKTSPQDGGFERTVSFCDVLAETP